LDQKLQQMKSDRGQYILKAFEGGEQEGELLCSLDHQGPFPLALLQEGLENLYHIFANTD
jgi:hypothetical protein